MNKALFQKIKTLCKDTGLSEKYLTSLTEKMGGSIEDDSTDETAIEEMANQVAEIATLSQGEATRWASKKSNETNSKKKKEVNDDDSGVDPQPEGGNSKKKDESSDSENEELVALKRRIDELERSKSQSDRNAAIKAAQAKHGIPDWRMKGMNIPDDTDPDEFLADIKQDLITQKLSPGESGGAKAATEKQVDEAANSLLESITAK